MTDEEILPTSFDELSDDQQNMLYARWTREHVEPEDLIEWFKYDEEYLEKIKKCLISISSLENREKKLLILGHLIYNSHINSIKPHVREKFETETEFAMEAMPDTVDQEVDAYFQEQIDNPKCEI